MSSSLRRGALAATTVALSIALLGACAAGNDAETQRVRPNNASTTVGDIKVQNVNLVTSTEEDGPVGISARLFNQSDRDQTLTAIRLPGIKGTVRLEPAEDDKEPDKAFVVPAGGSLALGGEGNASAQLDDAQAAGVTDGDAQRVVFDLSDTGEIELRATVVPATGTYEDHGPTVAPRNGPAPETSPGAAGPGEESSPADDKGTEGAEDGAADDKGADGGAEGDEESSEDAASDDGA